MPHRVRVRQYTPADGAGRQRRVEGQGGAHHGAATGIGARARCSSRGRARAWRSSTCASPSWPARGRRARARRVDGARGRSRAARRLRGGVRARCGRSAGSTSSSTMPASAPWSSAALVESTRSSLGPSPGRQRARNLSVSRAACHMRPAAAHRQHRLRVRLPRLGGAPQARLRGQQGAVLALTRAMAASYGRDGIRVNAICPERFARA